MSKGRAIATALVLAGALCPIGPTAADTARPGTHRAAVVTVYDGNRPALDVRATTNASGHTAYAWACEFNQRVPGSMDWSLCLRTQDASGALSPVIQMAPRHEGRWIDDEPRGGEPGFEVVMDDAGAVTVVWLSGQLTGDRETSGLFARRWSPTSGRGPVLTLAKRERRTWGPHHDVEASVDASGTVTVGWVEIDGGNSHRTHQPVTRLISVDGTVSDLIPLAPRSEWVGGMYEVGPAGGPAAFVWASTGGSYGTVWYRSWTAKGDLGPALAVGSGSLFDAASSPSGDIVIGTYWYYDHYGRTVQLARVIGRDGTLGDEISLDGGWAARLALNDSGRVFQFARYGGQTHLQTFGADGTSTPDRVVAAQNLDSVLLDPVVDGAGAVVISWAGPGPTDGERNLSVARVSADGSAVTQPSLVSTTAARYTDYRLTHTTWTAPDGRLRLAWLLSSDRKSSIHVTDLDRD